MRDFFIRAFEWVVHILVVLMTLGVIVGFVASLGQGRIIEAQLGINGFLGSLVLLVAGLLYVILVGGSLYLGLGVYRNTESAVQALERR